MNRAGKSEHLLVPLYVDALAVGKDTDGEAFADLSPNFDLLYNLVPLGALCSPQRHPQTRLIRPLEPGIHLHWALPAALTHGVQQKDERTPTFYRAPNRWLIVRTPAKRDGSRGIDQSLPSVAWVLESDRLYEDVSDLNADDQDDIPSNWYGAVEDGRYQAYILGAWFRYEDWCGRDEPAPPSLTSTAAGLTAVGPGNPFFAAFYPGCRNVFGFCDRLTEQDEGSYTYLVTGWYSRPEDDPLHVTSPNPHDDTPYDVYKRANLSDLKARWKLAGRDYPTATLCHGAVHGVTWKDKGNVNGVPQGRHDIAVGNNGAEALSALVRSRPPARSSTVEAVLCAFQYDMLSDPRHTPGIPEVDDEVHRRGFTPLEGGSRWVIERSERAEPDNGETRATVPTFPADPDIAIALGELNDLQELRDRSSRHLEALRWDYYALWFKQRLAADERLVTALSDKATDIAALASSLRNTEGEIEALVEKRLARKFRLRIEDGRVPVAGGQSDDCIYRLIKTEAPRFWSANDPTVLLSGPGVKPSAKYEAGHEETGLTCRVLEGVAGNMRFSLREGELVVDPEGRTLLRGLDDRRGIPLTPSSKDRLPFAALERLYVETYVLDPASRGEIALLALRNYRDRPGDPDAAVIDALAAEIDAAQRAARDEHALDESRRGAYRSADDQRAQLPPAFAVRSWEPTWSPLFMIWQIDWRPFNARVDDADFDACWSFADRRDYRLKQGALGEAGPENRYTGWVPLSPSIARQLLDRIEHAPTHVRERIGQVLSQPLSGLGSALVTRQEVLQFPPLDDDGRILGDVLALIGGHSMSCSPEFPPYVSDEEPAFYPLRAGQFRIRELWVVDAFGQLQKVVDDKKGNSVILAETLAPPAHDRGEWIPLPPRIMQPARLSFRWLSVAHEREGNLRPSDSNPATSPICGWIVPNHWEQSITVLDADGRMLGKLEKVKTLADDTALAWLAWPPVLPADEPGLATTDAGMPADIARFVEGVRARGAAGLRALLRLVREVQDSISSPTSPGAPTLNALSGNPLVLAKASLALELAAPPVIDQRRRDPSSGDSWVSATRFPVRLGDRRKGKDGLVGYFVNGGYESLRPAFAARETEHDYLDTKDILELEPFFPDDLSIVGDSRARMLTLLLDPRAGVYASCAVLPSDFQELSSYASPSAIAEMDLVIDAAPVIASAGGLRVPLSEEVSGQWSWGQFQSAGDDALPRWQTNDKVAFKDANAGVLDEAAEIVEGWITLDMHQAGKS